jgi:membrane-bound lytic murein transglycosylase MltF
MPSTAADKSVNIRDIHKPEQNIHAGAKYLAHLRDRYYGGGDVGEEDRVRFVLASYNAGPGNVARSRSRAARMGLDDKRWFRHVEMAVLRDVGQEPVQYVTNINKYYVLYRLHFEKQQAKGS